MENPTTAWSPTDALSLKHEPKPQEADVWTDKFVVGLIDERDRLKQRVAVLLEALQDFEEYLDASAAVYSSDYDLLGKVQLAILKASEGK